MSESFDDPSLTNFPHFSSPNGHFLFNEAILSLLRSFVKPILDQTEICQFLINTDIQQRNTIISFLIEQPPNQMSFAQYDFVFKVVLVGNSSVGKSSLLLRYTDKTYQDAFLTTIGVDFKIRNIDHEGSKVKLQMWDTAGQEKFRTITSAYYKGAQGVIFAFDLTDKNTLNDVKNWLSEVEKYNNKSPIKILVGTKSDLVSERQVSREQAMRFAENEGMTYLECSAKTNKNVDDIFTKITSGMIRDFTKSTVPSPQTVKPYLIPVKTPQPGSSKKTTCC